MLTTYNIVLVFLNPLLEVSLLSQLKEALLSELYLWYPPLYVTDALSLSEIMLNAFSASDKVLKNLVSLLCFNTYKFSAMWIKHRSSLDKSISISVLFCAMLSRFSCVQGLCDPRDCSLTRYSVHGMSLSNNTRVGCDFLPRWLQPRNQMPIF